MEGDDSAPEQSVTEAVFGLLEPLQRECACRRKRFELVRRSIQEGSHEVMIRTLRVGDSKHGKGNSDVTDVSLNEMEGYGYPLSRERINGLLREQECGGFVATCGYHVRHEDIEDLAQQLWIARERPTYDDKRDWATAEENLHNNIESIVIGSTFYQYLIGKNYSDTVMDIWHLTVVPQLRNMGIGSAIFKRMLHVRKPFTEMIMNIRATDELNHFPWKHGFKVKRYHRKFLPDGDDAVLLMRKRPPVA